MNTVADPWTRNWTMVSADLDLAHVMLPLSSFTLVKENPAGDSPAYRVMHNYQAPDLDCFAASRLVPAGDQQASFFSITGKEELPLYAHDTVGAYIEVLQSMSTYMTQYPTVQRLEGIIKMPCHAHSAQFPQGTQPHSPSTFDTPVHLYRFDGVVTGGLTLLVVRTPLSPLCPRNGDGTAMGVNK
jgi:hypothetical protein